MSERKVQNREIMRFSCTEEDSLYAIRRLREKEEKGQLSKSEERQLFYMENRAREGEIDLMPAVVYAAANQRTCCAYLNRAPKERQQEWYAEGIAWMRKNPAFLEKFGWKERKNAVLSAGLLSLAVRQAQEGEAGDEGGTASVYLPTEENENEQVVMNDQPESSYWFPEQLLEWDPRDSISFRPTLSDTCSMWICWCIGAVLPEKA